ncbi:type VII secretion protein EccB [Rhodococcus sp. WS4]|nr:type VII secretion protein EccB [Rhodococcus sp. WS4]
MPRFLTTKTQISGYRLLVRRIEQGFIRRDVRLIASPFAAQASAFSIGIGIASLVIIAGLVVSFINPKPARGNATILSTKSGSRFVMYQDALHPVTNLASARLIVGSSEDVKVVKDDELANYPRGLLMGIPAAPDAMVPREDSMSQWAVCSQFDASSALALTQSRSARTLVVAGESAIEAAGPALTEGEAMLVTQTGGSGPKVWLLYKGERTEIKDTARALKTTLGITETEVENATVVTDAFLDAFLDAVPVREPFAKPTIAKDGASSSVMPKRRVGSILTSTGVGEERAYLVLDDGLQPISPFVAQLLVNSGSPVVNDVEASEITQAPTASAVDVSYYPGQIPSIVNHHTACYDWSRSGDSASSSRIYALDSVPLNDEDRSRAVALLPPRGQTPQTDFFFTEPGKGWFVEVTGQDSDSLSQEQLWWISDAGVRYSISGNSETSESDALNSLGLDKVTPHRVPWSILRLLPEGNGLSTTSAKVIHETIPPDMARAPFTESKGLN